MNRLTGIFENRFVSERYTCIDRVNIESCIFVSHVFTSVHTPDQAFGFETVKTLDEVLLVGIIN